MISLLLFINSVSGRFAHDVHQGDRDAKSLSLFAPMLTLIVSFALIGWDV